MVLIRIKARTALSMFKLSLFHRAHDVDMTAIYESFSGYYKDKYCFIFTGYSSDFGQSCCNELSEVLRSLGLEDRWHNKITISEVVENMPSAEKKLNISASTCAFTLLRQLLLCNSDAMATVIHKNPEHNRNRTFKCRDVKKSTEPTSQLSPLDILTAVYQCCDPMLRELLVKKMFLCKIAIPFVFLRGTSDLLIDDWPLESMWIHETISALDYGRVINTKTYVVTFVRICRPNLSKSQILNALMPKKGLGSKPIFFDKTCKGGALPRKLNQNLIEVFWVPKVNQEKKSFESLITYLNLRGQLTAQTHNLVKRLSDCTVIFIDLETLKENLTENTTTINTFRRPVLFICGNCTDVPEDVSTVFSDIPVIFTIEDDKTLDMTELTSALESEIEKQLPIELFSLGQRLEKFCGEFVKSSSNLVLRESKKKARAIFDFMCKECYEPGLSRKHLTPASQLYSKRLGELVSETEKQLDIKSKATTYSQLKLIRRQQVDSCTPGIRVFLDTLIENSKGSIYIARGLKLLIEDYNNALLSRLKQQKANNLNALKSETMSTTEKKNLKECIERINSEIENLSLSTNHLFREIAHIYDSVIALKCNVNLPPVEDAALLLADLIISGYPIEIVDGESWYMPVNWLKCVFDSLSVKLNQAKLAVVSVLGLQSSGKSTLMNIMFGMDLQTRSGRCTRGVQMRLLPVANDQADKSMNFTHLLLIDTEGLRSPDVWTQLKLCNRDNQLATFVIGLAGVTLINNRGETFVEIKNILEVVVHAFLRLKLAEKTSNERRTCVFLHHNVTNMLAKNDMRDGFVTLLAMLDTAASECAKAEGSPNINQFNDIIRFDIDSHIFTTPHLWQGNYPLQYVNSFYSERLNTIRSMILQSLFSSANGYFATNLKQFFENVAALWSSVLSENFVFSFENHLELKAYYDLNEKFEELKWAFEDYCINELRIEVSERLGKCKDNASLEQKEKDTRTIASTLICNKQSALLSQLETIFEMSEYKNIVSKWKTRACMELTEMGKTLEGELRKEITKYKKKRLLKLKVSALSEDDMRDVREQTLDIARNSTNKQSKADLETFETEIWTKYKLKAMEICNDDITLDFRQCFAQELEDNFKHYTRILHDRLNATNWPNRNSVKHTLQEAAVRFQPIANSENKGFRKNACTGDLIKVTEPFINTFLRETETLAKKCLIPDTELSQNDVRCFLNELTFKYRKLKSDLQSQSMLVTPEYKVNCFLLVSEYAISLFEKHNRQYQRTHGVESQLDTFKLILQTEFKLVLDGRKVEERVAVCFSKAVLQLILGKIADRLPSMLLHKLKHRLPSSKINLLQNIYLHLMDLDLYDEYASFFSEPKLFATNFLNKFMKSALQEGLYKATLETMMNEMLWSIKSVIKQNIKTKDKKPVSEEEWYLSLKKDDPECLLDDHYFNYVGKSTYIEDMSYFKESLEKALKQAVDQYLTESMWEDTLSDTVLTVLEKDVINFLWGCDECCPFCREPCSKGKHVDGSHVCIQHRPTCCRGMRDEQGKACLEVCNYDVSSNSVYNCGAIDFKCNCKVKSNTKHKYRKYQDVFPKWNIDVSSIRFSSTLFWIWFIARHQTQLADDFKYRICVPDSWYDVTEEDARASLNVYIEQ